MATRSVLPTHMDPVEAMEDDSEHKFDDFPPVWSGSEDLSSSQSSQPDGPPPHDS